MTIDTVPLYPDPAPGAGSFFGAYDKTRLSAGYRTASAPLALSRTAAVPAALLGQGRRDACGTGECPSGARHIPLGGFFCRWFGVKSTEIPLNLPETGKKQAFLGRKSLFPK